MRLGVMGGTFDPIHNGHLVAASEVAYQLDLAEVVFIPTGQPWQKAGSGVSPAEDRFRMTSLAIAGDPRFTISRIDIERVGATYTVDTLRELRRLRPEDELFFITGADALASFPTWRDPEGILALAHLIGTTRPGYLTSTEHLPPGSASIVEIPGLDISSTDCRARVARGAPISYLVPLAVADYVAAAGLYRAGMP